jgi:hypothetical protein
MATTCLIQTPTPNLQTSSAFYGQIGFRPIDESNLVWTDGKTHIEINPDRYARAGVKIFKNEWHQEIDLLKNITQITPVQNGFVIADPSGTWIYLIEKEPPMLKEMHKEPYGLLGKFNGISIETMDIDKSALILNKLGFDHTGGSKDQGYIEYSSGDFSVSLMKPLCCPHLFFNPSLNYFNGQNNLSIIARLRELGVPFSEEITIFNPNGVVDNVVIRDPGGLGFFIFSD